MTSGRSCVVTGASEGIGQAVSAALVAAGWTVVGVSRSGGGGALAGHERFVAVAGDVADPATAEAAARQALARAPLAGWVNCAGIEIPQSAHALEAEDVQRQLDVNLSGTLWGASVAVRTFLAAASGGAIVNIGSVQSSTPLPGSLAYTATKGATDAITRQLAVEYAACGIRVNSVNPGAIDTPMNDRFFAEQPDPAAARLREGQLSPMGRLGTPDEVAFAVRWLLSDEASFVTGQCLVVDGGAAVRLASAPPESRVGGV